MLPLVLLAAVAPAASPLAVIRPAPPFELTSHDKRTVRLRDLRGKVVLVSFIFTTCAGSCPATSARMATAAQQMQQQGLFKGGGVRLVSITLDPKRDTPAVLRRYRDVYEVDGADWDFLTGKPADVEKVWTAWGMWARPLPSGSLDHPSRVFLVDKRGRIREVYNLDYFKPEWVVEDVRGLLGETE
jgi:protein SCO1/2